MTSFRLQRKRSEQEITKVIAIRIRTYKNVGKKRNNSLWSDVIRIRIQ